MATSVTVAPPPELDRCSPPSCVRLVGHDGECRPTWTARTVCGAWMPLARARCARKAGHAWEHRSPYALANDSARTSVRNTRSVVMETSYDWLVGSSDNHHGYHARDAARLLDPTRGVVASRGQD